MDVLSLHFLYSFFFTETPIQPLDLMDLLSLSLIFYLIAFCSASWEVSSALHSKFSVVYTISAVIFLTSEDASPPGTARFLQLLFFFYVLISVFSVHAFLKGLMSPSCLLIFKRGIPWKPFPWGSLWGDWFGFAFFWGRSDSQRRIFLSPAWRLWLPTSGSQKTKKAADRSWAK